MANTEKVKALKLVRQAEDAVTDALDISGLNKTQRKLLDELSDYLRDLDYFLVMSELKDNIAQLKEKSKRIKTLNNRTKKQIDKLKDVAEAIDKTAGAIGALAQAIAILAQAGLV